MTRAGRRVVEVLGWLAGTFAVAVGIALLLRARTPVAGVGALLLPVCGVAVLLAGTLAAAARRTPPPAPVATRLDGEVAQFYPRRAGWAWVGAQLVIALPGLWCVAMAIAGWLEDERRWGLLLFPAVFLLGWPVGALLGRLTPGGVWLTDTQLVDSQLGCSTWVALADVAAVAGGAGQVSLELQPGASPRSARSPWLWARRPRPGHPVIDVATLDPGFAERLRDAVAATGVRREPALPDVVDPGLLPARSPVGRAGEIVFSLALAAAGLAVVWLIEFARFSIPPAAHVLTGYAGLAALALGGHALALAAASGFPRLGPSVRDGVAGIGVRAWAGDRWLDVVLDLGLGTAGLAWFVLDLTGGGSALPWSVLLALAGAWFAVRAVLSLIGRKPREGVWVGGGEFVHDGPDGVRRVPVAAIRSVAPVTTGAVQVLLVGLTQPAAERLCPRLWRHRSGDPLLIRVDASRLGHAPEDLAAWLQSLRRSQRP